MPSKLRELMLLRHAKSEWKNSDLTDIERPLSDRGKKNASKMGRWIKENALIPDLILVSPAHRAQQTLRRICTSFPKNTNTITVESLYLADLNHLLQTLGSAPPAERIMIIGHNPGLENLLEFLNSEKNVTLFPTTSLAHFILPNEWNALEKGDGKLIQFIRSKDI